MDYKDIELFLYCFYLGIISYGLLSDFSLLSDLD